MKKKVYVLLIVAGVVAFMASQFSIAGDDMQKVTAEGDAKIIRGNKKAAKKAAIDDAKRNAVDQVASYVVSETVVENYELVKDIIIKKLAGYVHDYKVLESNPEGDNFHVKIEANVSRTRIAEDASIIYKEMDKPRIMILLPETNSAGDVEIKSSIAENVMIDFFRTKGFEVIDASVARKNIEKDQLKAAALGDTTSAIMLGARSGAEVIIVGTANAGRPEPLGPLYAATPTISVRALKTDNAAILATATLTGKGQGGSPDQAQRTAMTDTSTKVAKDIFWKVIKEWNQEKLSGTRIELVLTGVSYRKLSSLKKQLAEVEGVKEVQQREFAAPAAVLEITYFGDANRLADVLMEKKFKGLTLDVLEVSSAKIKLKVK